MRPSRLLALGAAGALLLACGGPSPAWGIRPEALPPRVTEQDLGRYTSFSADAIWGFQGRDYRGKDFTAVSVGTMAAQTFDLATRWPQPGSLPEGFEPAACLETGRDPGLGVRTLHDRGIDGRGISVAVFDKPIRSDHEEFELGADRAPHGGSATRLVYHEVFGDESGGRGFHFHGIAVASLLAGRTVGVAPGVTVHYFAVPDAGRNFHFYSLAAKQVLELNGSLPVDDRIRLVVISDGIAPDDPAREEWGNAVALLEGAAVTVLYSGSPLLKGMVWGGCPSSKDRSDPSCFRRALHLTDSKLPADTLLVPGDFRTMAANESSDACVYRGRGGWSWAIPYVAGLVAQAWQLDPHARPDDLMRRLRDTSAPSADGLRIVQPEAFVEGLGE